MKTKEQIRKKSDELVSKMADNGIKQVLGDIDSFIFYCEQTIDNAVKKDDIDLAIACEQEREFWHYHKSRVTGKNEYQLSAFLTEPPKK